MNKEQILYVKSANWFYDKAQGFERNCKYIDAYEWYGAAYAYYKYAHRHIKKMDIPSNDETYIKLIKSLLTSYNKSKYISKKLNQEIINLKNDKTPVGEYNYNILVGFNHMRMAQIMLQNNGYQEANSHLNMAINKFKVAQEIHKTQDAVVQNFIMASSYTTKTAEDFEEECVSLIIKIATNSEQEKEN